jgi:hypothetical protein
MIGVNTKLSSACTPRNRTRALGCCDPARGEACQHDDQPADQRAQRRDESEESGLNAQNEGARDPDDREPDPGCGEDGKHGEHLRKQPAFERFVDRSTIAAACSRYFAGAIKISPYR